MFIDNDYTLAQENKEILNEIGEIKQDPGLFQTVTTTLDILQETSEPFLLVIFGGHLSEVTDEHNPLIQSIKHVIESTVPETTLLVLTGSCRETTDSYIMIKENINSKSPAIPIFSKGNNLIIFK